MGASGEPLIRASQVRENLEALAQLGADNEAKVRAVLRRETVERVTASLRGAWLPVELDIELTEAVDRVLGRAQNRAWSRDALLRSSKQSLLGPVFSGAVRMFGLSPKAMYKFAPTAWNAVMRNCGELSVVGVDDTRVEVRFTGLPAAIARSAAYLEGMAGSLEAVIRMCGREGTVTVSSADVAAGGACVDVRWSA